MSLPTPAAFAESVLKQFSESPLKQRRASADAAVTLSLEAVVERIGDEPYYFSSVTGWTDAVSSAIEPDYAPGPTSGHAIKWSYLRRVLYQKTTDTLSNVYERTSTDTYHRIRGTVTTSTVDNHPPSYPIYAEADLNNAGSTLVAATESAVEVSRNFTDAYGDAIEMRVTYSDPYTEAMMIQDGLDLLSGKAYGLAVEDYYANPLTGRIYADQFDDKFPNETTVRLRYNRFVDTGDDVVASLGSAGGGANPNYEIPNNGWLTISGAKWFDDVNGYGTYWQLHQVIRNIPLTTETWNTALYGTTGYTDLSFRNWDFTAEGWKEYRGWRTPPTLLMFPLPNPGHTFAASPMGYFSL